MSASIASSFRILFPSRPHRLARFIAVLLALLLGANSIASAAGAHDRPPADPQTIHKQLAKRGMGKSVKLVRRDGSELKGNIAALSDETVDITSKQGATVTVSLSDVAQVEGKGLSTGAKVGIGVGVGILVTVGVLAIVVNHELNKPWGNL